MVSDRELSLYGAGDTIAARLAREVRDLRAQRAASRDSDAILARLRALLATEPAVSEERCGEIENSLVEAGNATGERENFDWLCVLIAQVPEALAVARQLHALHAGLREIVSSSVVPTSRPASDGPRKADSAPPAEDPDARDRVVIDPDDPEQLAEGLVAGTLDGADIAPESLRTLARSYLEILALLLAAQNDQQIAVLEAEGNTSAASHEITILRARLAALAEPSRDTGFAVRTCTNNSPPWFTGRWRDWHRGHGCDKDDGKPRTPEGEAEIAAHGRTP